MSAAITGERPILQVTGLNHRTADVELREKFALSEAVHSEALRQALAVRGVEEAVVLSTCNRVELVVAAQNSQGSSELENGLATVLSRLSGIDPEHFHGNLYHLAERSAVTHVFRVASGLDSLVIGEPQVLGQLKEAYDLAASSGATGGVLHRLFHRAFGVAKAVRTQTTISQNAVSVCYAARLLAQQIFGDLSDANVILLGAGDMGALAVRHLMSAGAKNFVILNKTLARAVELAELSSGVAGSLEQLPKYLGAADIIIGAVTLSPGDEPLIRKDTVSASQRGREGRPQFFIDLAVPRCFASAIDELSETYLYNIDDLKQVVDENMNARRLEAERAETIVQEEVERFWHWFESRHIEGAIRELSQTYQEFRVKEIEKTMRRFQRSGIATEENEELRAALEDLSQALLAKALHRPLTALKDRSTDPAVIQVFRELFLKKKSEDE